MGPRRRLAVMVGARPWMPRLLPLIEKTDMTLQRASGGKVSLLDVADLTNLTLRVPGRRSGVVRQTPLLCVPDGSDWLIAGSYFGNPSTPAWVHNLRACPTPQIVIKGVTIDVSVRETDSAERDRRWQQLLALWPNFALYEQRTDRTIPVFVLSPRSDSAQTGPTPTDPA